MDRSVALRVKEDSTRQREAVRKVWRWSRNRRLRVLRAGGLVEYSGHVAGGESHSWDPEARVTA